MKISDKKQMLKLLNQGAFGNKVRHWNIDDDIPENVDKLTVRYKSPNSAWCVYDQSPEEAREFIDRQILKSEAKREFFYFNESCPDNKLFLQGEVQRSIRGYDLTYSKVKKPMRLALTEETKHADGIMALTLIKGAMDIPSYENLQRLFDEYPDSVVEFSSYDCSLGDLRWNTLFWEVRSTY